MHSGMPFYRQVYLHAVKCHLRKYILGQSEISLKTCSYVKYHLMCVYVCARACVRACVRVSDRERDRNIL